MHIRALLPDIHQRPTGGNLFNRQILNVLEEVTAVSREVIDPDGALPARAIPKSKAGQDKTEITLIDSLLLDHARRLSSWQQEGQSNSQGVLVAHYLHLFEPSRRGTAEAAQERRCLPYVDGAITTSEYCREILIQEGLLAERTVAITPGLATAYSAPAPPRRAQRPRILTVASLLEGKGLRQLLGLLESLADLDWTWELAGDPELDAAFGLSFQQQVQASPLRDRIHLHGPVPPTQMPGLFDQCDLFVLPSRFETCSMATMEAIARGLPVLAYRVGGLPERVPPPNASLLAAPGDGPGLVDNLRRVLLDPDLANALGKANFTAGRAFPSWREAGNKLWSFLVRLAEENAQ